VIAQIRGRVVSRGADHVVVDVSGIGYKVFVPRQPEEGEVVLHTHHVIREDGQFLYGFASREELSLFDLLTSVSGVGPRAALALLSVSRPADLAAALASGDVAALARAPGIGKKTAERLIVDLRSKVSGLVSGDQLPGPITVEDEALAALQALGYTPAEAAAALRNVPGAKAATTEERVRGALRRAAPVV
jgi:Holliday junction DNA helicase RuvA